MRLASRAILLSLFLSWFLGCLIKRFRPSQVAIWLKTPILLGNVAQQNSRECSDSSPPTFHQPWAIVLVSLSACKGNMSHQTDGFPRGN